MIKALETSPPGWRASRTTNRSARRQTVRARCSSGRSEASSGEDESGERLELRLQDIDNLFETGGVLVPDRVMISSCRIGVGQRRAYDEELVLKLGNHLVGGRIQPLRPGQPQHGVQLVHRAIGFDADIVLGNSPVSQQSGDPVIAGLRVDFHLGILLSIGP